MGAQRLPCLWQPIVISLSEKAGEQPTEIRSVDNSPADQWECLSPGGLGDGITLSVIAGLVSVVSDGLGLAFVIFVGVAAAYYDDLLGFVFLVKSLLQLTLLLALDTVFSLETGTRQMLDIFFKLSKRKKRYEI